MSVSKQNQLVKSKSAFDFLSVWITPGELQPTYDKSREPGAIFVRAKPTPFPGSGLAITSNLPPSEHSAISYHTLPATHTAKELHTEPTATVWTYFQNAFLTCVVTIFNM